MRRGSTRRPWSLVAATVLFAVALVTVAGRPDVASAGPDYTPLADAARLVDTRAGGMTVDGIGAGIGMRSADSTLEVQVGGRAGLAADVEVVVLTVTVVAPADRGFITAHPTGTMRPLAASLTYEAGQHTTNTVIATVGPTGQVSLYTSAAAHLVVDVAGSFPTGSYTALPTSARLADTRPGESTVDGVGAGTGLLTAGATLEIQVGSRAGLPTDVEVVVLTITAVGPADRGFLTAHPTGTTRPLAASTTYEAGHNTTNTVIARVGTGGNVSVYTSAMAHLVVDVSGHLPPTSYTALAAPARLADTREGTTTADGLFAGGGPIPGGRNLRLTVAGRAGLPADASAAVLTLSAVQPSTLGFSTVHPTGDDRPLAANLTYDAGRNTSNTLIAPLGAGGEVCVYASYLTHFVVDVAGYLSGPAPPAAGPGCPPEEPIHAVWPAANVLFDTPEAAATDFLAEVFGVTPALGEFMWGDSLSGEIDVLHPGDDADPSTFFWTGTTLALRRMPVDFGWFVIGGTSTGVTITSPEARDTVPDGLVTVEGLGRGFEANTISAAFIAGDADPLLDLTFTSTDWSTPTPYSMTLDISDADPGDVVGLVVRGDTGLDDDPSEFATIPVLVGP